MASKRLHPSVHVLTASSPQPNPRATDVPVVVNQIKGQEQPDDIRAEAAEEAEVLQASIKAGSVAQIVVAAASIIGLIYLLKLVLVTTLVSVLLAFVLEPLVRGLAR